MDSNELRGVIVPIVVPLDENDQVDENAFRRLIQRLIQSGVHGLFVGGSAGEGPLLTMREWIRLVEIAYVEARGEVPLLGGVMDSSTRRVLEKIAVLADIGYRYFVVSPTYYIASRTDDEHMRLFGECQAHSAGMEMLAYNIPSRTGSVLSVGVLCEMARRGWIRYCKDSSGDWPFFYQLLIAGKQAGLKLLMGNELCIAPALLAGASGLVPACSNVEPKTYVVAYEAALRGDTDELWRRQERITFLRQSLVLSHSSWLAGIKYALSRQGIGSDKLASPLQPLTSREKRMIDERLSLECA